MRATSNYQHSDSTPHREATDQTPVMTKLSLKAEACAILYMNIQKKVYSSTSDPPQIQDDHQTLLNKNS